MKAAFALRVLYSPRNRFGVSRICGSKAHLAWNPERNLRQRRREFSTSVKPFKEQGLYHQEPSVSLLRHGEPTIYALSTASGRAAIAIIRISGPASLHVYRSLCLEKAAPKPRYATVRTLYEPGIPPSPNTVLDSNALVLYFPAPRTVTGEDMLELHIHGGTAIVKAVLASIAKCSSDLHTLRYAEPGEFTRRAFMNARLDLTQVEALGDALSATTEQQRKLSVRGAANGLARLYERWRKQLLYARGELEALIDFSEDQHFDESPAELCSSVSEQVRVLKQMLLAHNENAMKGELLRHGISVALLGAPNVGKSSLLNQIVGREAAIVSHEAGTTRDVVEVGIDLGGYFCRLGDTAGLRRDGRNADGAIRTQQVVGQIEIEGMRRSRQRASESDVVIVVLSFERVDDLTRIQYEPEVLSTAKELVEIKDNVFVLLNKSDLLDGPAHFEEAIRATANVLPGIGKDRIHLISCMNAEKHSLDGAEKQQLADPGGIQAFLRSLIQYFSSLTTAVNLNLSDSLEDASVWQESLGASERHRLLLLDCVGQLNSFLLAVDPASVDRMPSEAGEADIVIAAEHLRAAADCLAKITGKDVAGDVEEVLGVVFEKFCVGK